MLRPCCYYAATLFRALIRGSPPMSAIDALTRAFTAPKGAAQLLANSVGDSAAEPAPSTLTELDAERERLEAERHRLAAVERTRANAEATLAACTAAHSSIDAAESAAWAAWMAAPETDTPKPLVERRAALAQRRLLASGDMASVLNAAKAVTPREIGAELAAIEAAIFKHRLDAVMADVVKVHAQTIEAATKLSEATASLYGFDRILTQLQSAVTDATRAHLQAARAQFAFLLSVA
jgi:hypothetical protein